MQLSGITTSLIETLRGFNVGARLRLSFTLMLLLMGALLWIGLKNMGVLHNHLQRIVAEDYVVVGDVNTMRDAVRFQALGLRDVVMQEDLSFKKKELKRIKEARLQYQEALKKVDARLAQDEQGKKLLQELTSLEEKVLEQSRAALDLSLDDKHQEAGEVVRDKARPLQNELIQKLEALLTLLMERSEKSAATAEAVYETAVRWFAIIGAVVVVCVIGLAWAITRSITMPLSEALAFSRKISSGDLTGHVKISGRDETSALLKSLEEMNQHLVDIIRGVKDSADTVASSSGELVYTMDETKNRVEMQNDRILAVTAAVEETSAASNEIQRGTKEVLAASTHSQSAAEHGASEVQEAVQATERIVDTVTASGEITSDLSKAMQKITEVAQVISDIADQTNLLALNAAIEAARAGEQGRGFAVVADEVRTLAQRTATSTKDISKMVGTIKGKTSAAVDSMEKVRTEVESGAGRSRATQDALTQIVSSAHQVTDLSHQINLAAREQVVANDETAKNMAEISRLTAENHHSLEHITAASKDLAGTAARLQQLVNKFKLPVGRVRS